MFKGNLSTRPFYNERLVAMRDFFETMSAWYEQIDQLPTPAVIKFVKLGGKLQKLLG